jgi:hypothetical protein
MAGRAMQEMPEFQCRKNRPSDADKTELLMQEKLLCPCRGMGGDCHGSEFAAERRPTSVALILAGTPSSELS